MGHVIRRSLGTVLPVVPLDTNRQTPCPAACFHISPPVADHEAPREIDPVLGRRAEQQPRLGFAAGTAVSVVMIAHENIIEGKLGAERGVDLLHRRPRLNPSGDVRLVGDHDERKPGCA